MSWIWMNMALAAAFFAAWCGIPLWMVLRHPTWGPEPADGGSGQAARPAPAAAFDRGGHPVAARAA